MAAVVVLLGAAGAAGGSDDDGNTDSTDTTLAAVPTTNAAETEEATGAESVTTTEAGTTTTTSEPAATTTTEAATTTTSTTTPPTTLPPEPLVFSGAGDNVVDIGQTDRIALHATHDGARNFIVTYLDQDLQPVFNLGGGYINSIGAFDGTVMLGAADEVGDIRFLQVQADGSWSLELLASSQLVQFSDTISGSGNQVLVYTGPAQVLHLTHDGARNFIVMVDDPDAVVPSYVNEIGPYDGRVPFPAGPSYVSINADGNWTISP